MRKFILATASALSLAAGGAFFAGDAQAAPLFNGLQGGAPVSNIEHVQFFFGGRNYCFYPDGWHGPGWYWCGYAFRRGFGWGGGEGFHGWVRGGRGGPFRGPGRGGPVFHPLGHGPVGRGGPPGGGRGGRHH